MKLWTTKYRDNEPGIHGCYHYPVYSPDGNGVIMASSPADAGRICRELNNLISKTDIRQLTEIMGFIKLHSLHLQPALPDGTFCYV